jgi:hypothetical protein|tara:strand:+ start:17 stop:658 length:642 start_codon:yes stop_codon:yes gene_type:complete
MKHVLYIGQPYDPLDEVDIQNRKKVGITQSVDKLPIREGQLKRDAGTIMPFGYVVVKAWEFKEEVASNVEKLIHNIRQPYAGEWILDEDLSLVDAITCLIDNLKYESSEIDLGTYTNNEEVKKARQSNSWAKLERELYEKIGEVELTIDTWKRFKPAEGTLKEDGYYVDGQQYSTIAKACRCIVGNSSYCYKAFKINGRAIAEVMKENNIDVV